MSLSVFDALEVEGSWITALQPALKEGLEQWVDDPLPFQQWGALCLCSRAAAGGRGGGVGAHSASPVGVEWRGLWLRV